MATAEALLARAMARRRERGTEKTERRPRLEDVVAACRNEKYQTFWSDWLAQALAAPLAESITPAFSTSPSSFSLPPPRPPPLGHQLPANPPHSPPYLEAADRIWQRTEERRERGAQADRMLLSAATVVIAKARLMGRPQEQVKTLRTPSFDFVPLKHGATPSSLPLLTSYRHGQAPAFGPTPPSEQERSSRG